MPKVEEHMPMGNQKTITLVMATANKMMNEMGVKEAINEQLKWDKAHWGISPGGLLKALVISTFTDIRIPLTHIQDRLYNVDLTYLLDENADTQSVNSFNVGRALERLGETDYNGLYERLALTALQKYNIPVTNLNSNTTTVSFYGEYDISKMNLTEEEQDEIIKIEKGYNKDGRPASKQAVVGQVTTEHGIPLISRTLDGATSDVDWNREALTYLERLRKEGFNHGIYVADSKLVTEELVCRMTRKETKVSFVSRCPANFSNKLEERMINRAYRNGKWEDLGTIGAGKNASQYRSSSSIEYHNGSMIRLIVLESSSLKAPAEQSLVEKRSKLTPIIKEIEKKDFAC